MTSSFGWPTVLELHDRPSGKGGAWWFRRFARGSGARRLLVTTEALLAWMEENYAGLRLRSLALVSPNGVNLAQYADLPQPPAARAKLGLPPQFTVGYTGHLYPGRGIGLLFELARRHPQISFVMAGGTESDVSGRRAALEQAGLTNVRLLGHVPQAALPMVQAAADVLVMPYQSSITISGGGDSAAFANPMKAAEYLACGRPVLSSDLPVLREVLTEDNARLLPPDDVDAWSAALQDLQRDARARETLSSAARTSAAGRSGQARAERALHGLP